MRPLTRYLPLLVAIRNLVVECVKRLLPLWVAIAVLTFGYLMRHVPVPPDCINEPDHPVCKVN